MQDKLRMEQNRQWMYKKNLPGRRGFTEEFCTGVEEFLTFASEQFQYKDGSNIRCSCFKCKNFKFQALDKVREHLYRYGLVSNYYNWTCHGEIFQEYANSSNVQAPVTQPFDDYNQFNPYQRMVFDAVRQNTGPNWGQSSTSYEHSFEQGGTSQTVFQQDPLTRMGNEEGFCERFWDAMKAADQPLWDGCQNHSQLSATSRILNIKAENNMSENCFNSMLKLMPG
ncbi:hypothetical protein ACH5RR_023228 [Cinchona calisaya]|uniref:Transposase-associated domain-containing protein n=1 Tax=Cinchona calisaya TaxID=153742 RepID=A0ABD2ZBY6_9GENT